MTQRTIRTLPWTIAGRDHHLGRSPWLMGIVNVTPDSFSDGGRFVDSSFAVDHAMSLVEQGANILDIGGESTRPGAEPVSASDERKRVVNVIERLAELTTVPLSIDTMKADVASAALAAGATIVNDVSGLTFDPRMPEVCAAADCGVIVMHMQGTPQTMQDNPTYDNVVADVVAYLQSRVETLVGQGIAAERIAIDPGIGFGKTAEHNLALLSHIATLRELGRPVLIGHSRKRFLGKLLGKPIDERTSGTIGVAIALAEQQTDIIRVHDVGAVKDALRAWEIVRDAAASEN